MTATHRRELTLVPWPRSRGRCLPLLRTRVVDCPGRRRMVTMPGYRRGCKPGNWGKRYPAELLTRDEMLALLDATGKGYCGARDRALYTLVAAHSRSLCAQDVSKQRCSGPYSAASESAKSPCKSMLNSATLNVSLRRSAVSRYPRYGSRPIPWQERFWRYVTPGAPDDCWEWQGSKNTGGYGQLGAGGAGARPLVASRVSYELHHGAIPDGMFVLHRCDNRPCVNPAHLFLGSQKDNMQDMFRKGRQGERFGSGRPIPQERLSDADVRRIREFYAAGASLKETMTEFGLCKSYAHILVTGQRRTAAGGPITRRRAQEVRS